MLYTLNGRQAFDLALGTYRIRHLRQIRCDTDICAVNLIGSKATQVVFYYIRSD